MDAKFRPVDRWPGKRTGIDRRRRAPFRSTYSTTLRLLDAELGKLNARDIVIQAGFRLDDLRNDGWPRSNARRPLDPGVILSFQVPKRVEGNADDCRRTVMTGLSFPCDKYVEWEDNLRAIALSLVALRAVDRYGVTRHAEQYRGWAQLPAAAPADTEMSKAAAARFISEHSGMCLHPDCDRAEARSAYLQAAKKLHPDTGGDREDFVTLHLAWTILTEGK